MKRQLHRRPKRLFRSISAVSPATWTRILEIAKKHDLKVIEDAAHALPASYHGAAVGTIGDITCFSFYATKTITTGEGGMATTENPEWADRMRMMSLHGISHDAWKRYAKEGSWYYEVIRPGFKYNLTDIAAAIGIEQLKKCDAFGAARNRIATAYQQGVLPIYRRNSDCRMRTRACSMLGIFIVIQLNLERLKITRDQFIEAVKGIRDWHLGALYSLASASLLSRQASAMLRTIFQRQREVYQRIISLPIYPKMTEVEYRAGHRRR